jgi:hypothetical protein
MMHTPGPWEYRQNASDTFAIVGRNPDAGKTGVPYSGPELTVVFDLEDEDDARLIAAAPRMLEALRRIAKRSEASHYIAGEAEIAIRKATGER